MVKPLVMKIGEKLWLNKPVVHWRLFSEENPAVVAMFASVQAAQAKSSLELPCLGNTVLAVEMTPEVAMLLHEELDELGRRNGWLGTVS